MAKLATINHKSNGQVFPVDEEIENTNIQVPVMYGDTGLENNFVQKNALHPLFNEVKDEENGNVESNTKTKIDGRKLKTLEIVSEYPLLNE